jgi:hypothetical protein
MHFRPSRIIHSATLLLGALFALAACSNQNSGSVPAPTPTPANSVTFALQAAGGSQAIPAATTGISATMTYPNVTTGAGTNLTLAVSGFTAPSGTPALNPPNSALDYFSLSDPATVTFSGLPGFSFTLPAGITTASKQFYLAFYDPKNAAAGWQTGYSGPGTVNGQTVAFATRNTPFTMSAGLGYNFVLYSVNTGPTPTPAPVTQNIYVSNGAPGPSRNTIDIFPAGSNGNVIPTGTIGGPLTGLNAPVGLTFNSAGVLYVANTGSITEYAAGARGNVAPSTVITSATLVRPQLIALDQNANIYVTQNAATGGVDSYQVYAAGASGASTPTNTVTGSGLSLPVGIAVDAKGNVYVANNGNSTVSIFAAGSNGNAAPTTIIAGALTGLSNPTGLTLDPTGNIYVANSNGSIVIFKPGTTGNAAPLATISGNATFLNSPYEIYLDLTPNLYVANNGASGAGANSALVFLPTQSGNAFPVQDITGPSTGLAQPIGIAAY